MANLALLFHMGRALSFAVAQPITIVGWYVSSFLLIALVVAAPARLRLPSPPEHGFTQAFYYAIIAAVLYFIVASLLLVTVYGAYRGRYSQEFKLTVSQRTLMLQTISFLCYLLLGALVFSRIEGWDYLDSVYWADVTILTVGFGDLAPSTHLGRALLLPFSIGGTMYVGLVIGSIRALILERGKEKMAVRLMEKTRETAMKHLDWERNTIKLGTFTRTHFKAETDSTEGRLRQEFRVMRKVQREAARRGRWTSFVVSVSAWLLLWFLGAVVFWRAEFKSSWTYFQSMYFSYVALLTIGYGDFRPQADSSRAFFVFWSLLAVPTMTIVISNVGDTVVTGVRDVTLWVGEWTVLPGEKSIRKTLQSGAVRLRGRRGDAHDVGTEVAGGFSGERRMQGDQAPQSKPDGLGKVAREVESSENAEADRAADKGDADASDEHHEIAVLMKEMRKVLGHLNASPPKKYTYEEWTRFLELIEEDVKPSKTEPGHSHEETPDQPVSQEDARPRRRRYWTWLSPTSPLMSNKGEAEWIVGKLALTLERKLKKQREERERKEKSQ